MNLRTWYGSSVRIPYRYDFGYPSFAASCIGLVRTIISRKLEKEVHVRFTRIRTANADIEGSIINISKNFLDGDFGGSDHLSSEKSLSAILGVIVHEAAHFAYTPRTLEPFVEYIRDRTKLFFHERVAAGIANILEDIFIESEVVRQVPSIAWMLDELHNVMSSEDIYEKVMENCAEVDAPPKDMKGVAAAMDAILLAKVYNNIESNPFITSAFNLALAVRDMVNLEDRIKLSLEMYNLLMEGIEEETEPCDANIEVTIEGVVGITADMTTKASSIQATKDGVSERDFGKVNVILEQLEDSHIETGDDEDSDVSVYVEKVMPFGSVPVSIDDRYVRLAELARQKTAVNRPYGLDGTRGNNIRKLYRIATDQKIFAERVPFTGYIPMQVVILVDYSGSMMGLASGGKSRLEAAVEAAVGAAYGLTEGRCEVAVYGHTGDIIVDRSVIIYAFKHFRDPIGMTPYRFETDNHDLCSENRDGYALTYVAKKFNGSRKKLLIHISDGAPAADGYGGEPAERHCKDCVAAIRKQGIEVLSISITTQASRANDFIYGSKWNVFNEDPNIIEKVVESLIQ